MAGCGPWTVSLFVISTLIHSALTEWNFTVQHTGELYSFYACSCREEAINCSNESLNTSTAEVLENRTTTLSTTAMTTSNTTEKSSTAVVLTSNTTEESSTAVVPTTKTTVESSTIALTTPNTTEASLNTSFQFQNCSCKRESRICSVNTTSSSANSSTVWAFNSQNFTVHECHIIEPPKSDCSNVSTIQEWTEQMNASNIFFAIILSNEKNYKYFNCSTAVPDPNLESLCTDNTTTPSETTAAPTTTTAKSSTNRTGMIITVTIVAVNVALAVGVCTFILCKRRQISVNIRRKEKALQELAETSNIVRPTPNTTRVDRHITEPKTLL